MPFRIKVSLAIILTFVVLALVGPLVVPVSPLQGTRNEAQLALPDSSFTEVDGLAVHHIDMDMSAAGSPVLARPLLLLHGYLFNTQSWRNVQPSLAQTGPVISFDRTGFGLSERPPSGSWTGTAGPYSPEGHARQTVALLDELGIDQAVLVGHNSGAATALEVALEAPERVAGLVLVSPAVYNVGGPPGWLRPLLGTPHLSRLGPLLMRQLAGDTGAGFVAANWADPSLIDDAALQAFAQNFQANDWDKALWEISKASHEVDFLDVLGTISVPTLVVNGAADTVVPPDVAQELASDLGNATFALLDGCGHVPHEECAPQFSELLLTWLLDEKLLLP